MTDAGWAERKVERKLGGQYISLSPKLTAELLLAEHRRAVRVVKRTPNLWPVNTAAHLEMEEARRVFLAALQKGRT